MQKNADPDRAYLPPIQPGETVRASGLATVLASKSSKWAEGSRVMGQFGWYDFGVIDESKIIAPAM
jgi:NADPH-dependent curcumin reductase CurA